MKYKDFEIADMHADDQFIILKTGTKLGDVPEKIKKEFPYPFRLAGDDFYTWENGKLHRHKEYITTLGLSKINPDDADEYEYALPLDDYGMGMNGDTVIEYMVDGKWQECAIG